jgi:microcystin-dependent protein
VGTGQVPGRPPVALGQPVSGTVPGLGLNYLICLDGAIPTPDGDFPSTGQFVGQVIAYAGSQPPPGWALCDGSLQPIADYTGLFLVIGTTYGGDGQTNFALPNLGGVMLAGM